MGAEVKLTPEEVDRVKGIIAQAYSEMTEVARGIGGQSGNLHMAYTGAGTATGVQNYENLGKAGEALGNALDRLSQDLGVTAAVGRETDDAAHGAMGRVVAPNVNPDAAVAGGI
ncbi:hypothetical protein ACHZ98_34075 [Streptomyces sp. MAR4 CNY-716]